MVDFPRRVGRRLSEMRIAAGLSQRKLAARVGMHQSYISGVECGRRNPGLLNVERIAAGLGVSMADLFAVFRDVPPRRWG